jgi:hypothetical protein
MGFFRSQSKEFFCAFCKTPRKIKAKKHIESAEVSMSLAASVLLMFLFFQKFDFRVIPMLSLFLCFFEFLVQIQYRLSLACTHCGFDPLLYMKSQKKACDQVKTHLERRKNDPTTLLSPRPKLDLPVIKKRPDDDLFLSKKSNRLDVRL